MFNLLKQITGIDTQQLAEEAWNAKQAKYAERLQEQEQEYEKRREYLASKIDLPKTEQAAAQKG